MHPRTRDRLKALETKIAPKVQVFVFLCFDAREPGSPTRDEQLAAFRVRGTPTQNAVRLTSWRVARRGGRYRRIDPRRPPWAA
jgi:hypothetical protein